MTRIDWTLLTDDPNNGAAKEAVRDYLLGVRRVHTGVDLNEFIDSLADGRTVLDIGVAAHAARYLGDVLEHVNDPALSAYHLVKRYTKNQLLLKRLAWRFSPLEWSFPDFLYEFAGPR